MAFEKRPGGKGKGSGFNKNSGFRPGQEGGFKGKPSGDRPQYGKPRQDGDKPQYGKPGRDGDKPQYGKPRQDGDRPQYGAPRRDGDRPQYGAPRRDGDRPQYAKPRSDADTFFGGKPGPRRAAPTNRPVPPAMKVDERPRREFAPKAQFERPQFDAPESQHVDQDLPRDNILAGRNPIREAIKSGRTIDKLLVQEGELSGSARQIVAWAREAKIIVQHVDKARLDQIYPNHQGMIAFAAAAEYSSIDAILEYAKEKGEEPFVIVLDSITDPHNLGAIIRTAECAGAHGVIVCERRSALLTPSAVKASAGACEYQRVAKVVNLGRALDELKEHGLWVIGADMAGEPAQVADLSGAIALVIGSEGEGISHLVSSKCDKMIALPIKGKVDSLNASVAAGVLMYEVLRARS